MISEVNELVNVGILGEMDCGKTSIFILFVKSLEARGDRILTGQRGGDERELTLTVDFIRFTYQGFTHTLYGTGGHRVAITDYYRLFVLRNADKFLCMIDLSIPLEQQLEFFRTIGTIPTRSVVLSFNKYDLVDSKLVDIEKEYIQPTVEFFESDLKRMIQKKFITVALEKQGFADYNTNSVDAILNLCEWSTDKPFDVWTS